MYKSFEELLLHVSNKALYYIQECEVATELDRAIELYCLGMAFLNKHHIKDLKDWYGVTEMGADYSAHFDEINNALHLMHEREPQLREKAAEDYWLYIEEDLKLQHEIIICADTLHLSGKGSVPEDVQDVIKEALKPVSDDINIKISPTWYYSHLGCGDEYDYSEPEQINVTISSYSEETVSLICETYEGKIKTAVEEYLTRRK